MNNINRKPLVRWWEDSFNGWLLLVLLIVTLLPLYILSFYNHPGADDFGDTVNILKYGFWGVLKYYYLKWSGRYTEEALAALSPLGLGFYWGYKLNVVILLTLFLSATYWLSGVLFKGIDKLGKIGISSLFVFSYIIIMPQIKEGIFWQSCSSGMLTSCIMTLFWLGCVVNYYYSPNKKRYIFFSFFLAFAIIGCYEPPIIYTDLIVLLILFISMLRKQKITFPLALLIVCICFSLFSIMAPGNYLRGSSYKNAHDLMFSLNSAFKYDFYFLIQWHWLPFILFICLVLFDLLYTKTIWTEVKEAIFVIPPWISFVLCLVIPFVSIFICAWAEGQEAPLRMMDDAYFYFIAGMMYFLFSIMVRIKKRYPEFRLPVYVRIPMYIALVGILVYKPNNITRAYTDIVSGTARAYDKEMTARREYIMNFKGDSCTVDSIRDIPESLFFIELPRHDNINWMNTSFWEYYHKKYIGVRGR